MHPPIIIAVSVAHLLLGSTSTERINILSDQKHNYVIIIVGITYTLGVSGLVVECRTEHVFIVEQRYIKYLTFTFTFTIYYIETPKNAP